MWSSVRDPYSVFTLLETIYSAFDEVANRRNVFKVETIGDCYVAGMLPLLQPNLLMKKNFNIFLLSILLFNIVVGLPKPRRNHAVVMAKYAQEILQAMKVATTELDNVLGPGTAELAIRIGLNSGPTTGKFIFHQPF
jgi:class 3 adenylate cyclase